MNDEEFFNRFYKNYLFIMDVIAPDLTPAENVIYSKMIRKAWAINQDYTNIAISDIIRETGLAKNTVKQSLRGLINHGLIKISAKQTSKTARSYKVPWPEELKYYNSAYENTSPPPSSMKFNGQSSIENNSESGRDFIFFKLDEEDKGLFEIHLRALKPDELNHYREKAEEALKDKGLELTEKNVTGQRNDFIILENFGPIRLEKYL